MMLPSELSKLFTAADQEYSYLGIPLTGVTTKGSVVVHGGLPQNVG